MSPVLDQETIVALSQSTCSSSSFGSTQALKPNKMGMTASKANKDGSITTGGFKFVSIRGDPQYNHYFRMLELGMSMEQVRLLLERDSRGSLQSMSGSFGLQE